MVRLIAVILTLCGVGTALFALRGLRGGGSGATEFRVPIGHEQQPVGTQALSANGFNIPQYADCPMADAYTAAQLMLGPPIAPFNGQSMTFLFGKLRCEPRAGGGRATWEDLGMADLLVSGRKPQPDSEPAQPVREHINNARETGLNVAEVFGRVISPPELKGDGTYVQYTDKQRLMFHAGDAGSAVQWTPLGCTLSHLCQAQAPGGDGVNLQLLLVGVVAAVVGLGLFVATGRGRGFEPAMI